MRQQFLIAASLCLLVAAAGCGSTTGSPEATATAPASVGQPSASVPASSQQAGESLEPGEFASLGTLGVSLQTATRLADGRVLLAAGVDCTSQTSCPNTGEVRLFDPATNGFTVAGPLMEARSELAAVLLGDGSVLFAGGTGQPGTELFSPQTGKFAPGPAMSTDRHGLAAALLPGGRVLVSGGWGGPRGAIKTFASAEIYDPATKAFGGAGSMMTARSGHTATTLKDGRVLIVGGKGAYPNNGLASAEIYDPTSGLFTDVGSMAEARQNHTAALLADGRVLVLGGESGIVGTTLMEVFDPATGAFSPAGRLPGALVGVSATTMSDGRVLIAGGRSAADEDEALDSNAVAQVLLFDPAAQALSPGGSMTVARERHTAVLLADGRVLLAGGWNESGQVDTAELYQP